MATLSVLESHLQLRDRNLAYHGLCNQRPDHDILEHDIDHNVLIYACRGGGNTEHAGIASDHQKCSIKASRLQGNYQIIAAQSMLAAMKECTGTYPTLGMPTQFPELKRTSQNLSYWNRKAALDLQREQCERLLAELYTVRDHKRTNNTLAAGLWPLQIEHFCVAILRPRQQAAEL